jgi:DNA-binding CsgD family transcriptional regulator
VSRTSAIPIVGRDAELSVLFDLIADLRAGLARQAVIEGEPGIGKTRLVAELRHGGFAAFRAAAEELTRDRPFGPLIDALGITSDAADESRRALAELLRATDDSIDRRFRIVEAIEDLFEREAMRQPVLIVFEDAHWADPGSLLALHRVARREDMPVLLLVTCRPVPRSPELRRFIDAVIDVGGVHLRLAPLDDESVSELARDRLGATPGPRLSEQLERAAGNPLFVIELLGSLSEEHLIAFGDGIAETTRTVSPPPSLRTVVVRRLSGLRPRSVEMLRAAAVLGESFSARDLAIVADAPLPDVLEALDEPVDAGFVTGESGTFTFRHDLVRDALYEDIAPAARKAMHLHTAHALAGAGAEPIRIAEHLALGAEAGDRQAAMWMRDAAVDVAPRAPVTAAELLQRAARLLPPGDHDRINFLLPAVQQLVVAGRIADATELADRLAPELEGSPLEIFFAFARLNLLGVQMRLDELAAYCERLLENPHVPEQYRILIVMISAGVRAFLRGEPRALGELEEVRPFIEEHPDTLPSALIFLLDGIAAWSHGRFADAAVHFARAVPGMSVGSREGQTLSLAGAAHALADRVDDAFEALRRARQQLEQRGLVQYLIENHWLYGAALFGAGRWDDALAEVAASRALSEVTGAAGNASFVPDPTPLIHAFRGDAAAARETLDALDQQGVFSTGIFTNWTAPIRAVVNEFAGARTDALETLRSWEASMREFGFVPDFRSTGRTLVRIGRRDDELLHALRAGARAALQSNDGVKSAEGAALLVAGAVDGDAELLSAAVDAARAGGRPFDVAEACAETAIALLRRGDRADATHMMDEAFRRYDELGAESCAAVLARETRELGIRRRSRRSPAPVRHGWDALTETERRVVALVAEGLTNAEIGGRLYVSGGTVATHLRSIFRKVAVSSRAELAAEAVRRHL